MTVWYDSLAVADVVPSYYGLYFFFFQDDPMYEVGLDIRSQLRVFEQIDEVERKKRDARERDILMRAARVRHSIHC